MDLTYPPEAEALPRRGPEPGWRRTSRRAGATPEFRPTGPERKAFNADWVNKLHQGGWICASWPTEYGGKGLSLIELVVLNEEFARARRPHAGRLLRRHPRGPDHPAVGHRGTEAGVHPEDPDGTISWCQGFSEPDAGSDLARSRRGPWPTATSG